MAGTKVKARSAEGAFYYADEQPLFSSGSKTLFRGVFRDAQSRPHDALMVVFGRGCEAGYANELACLSRNGALGVGPRLLSPFVEHRAGGDRLALVEEYAGVSLEKAIFEGCPVPFADDPGQPLAPAGSDRRVWEGRKIVFDVMSQLYNLHERGIFHRDLRSANVCVKRYGPDPQDLRATIVDFDLASLSATSAIAYRNEPYVHLFSRLPNELHGTCSALTPTALQIDMGYLAALQFEVFTGKRAWLASAAALKGLFGPWPVFAYLEDGRILARTLDPELDLAARAERIGLTRVDAAAFPDPAVLDRAVRTVQHGGYADACDKERLESDAVAAKVQDSVSSLAQAAFARYVGQVQASGGQAPYRTLDAQPDQLKASTDAQVRDIPNKVHALGYALEPLDSSSETRMIREFSPDEVEYLAFLEHRRWCAERKDAGWTYGPVKDVRERVSDCLIPYDQLSEPVKEYDRVHVRSIPALLESIGLAVTPPQRDEGPSVK